MASRHFCIVLAAAALLHMVAGRPLQQSITTLPLFKTSTAADPGCPLPAMQHAQVDFSSLTTSCGSTADLCSACFCSLFNAFSSAYAATSAELDASVSPNSNAAAALVASTTKACLAQYEDDISAALKATGLSMAHLATISECPFMTSVSADVPSCIQRTLLGQVPSPVAGVAKAG